MEISEYLGLLRKGKLYGETITLTDLSQKSGVDAGQISRIERGQNRPTVFSLVRLCYALNVDLSDLLSNLGRAQEAVDLYQESHSKTRSDCLTPVDIAAFLKKFKTDISRERALLGLTSRIVQISLSECKSHTALKKKNFYKKFWLYPTQIDEKNILQVYLEGGAVTLYDLGHMISLAREKKSYSVHKASKKSGLDYDALQLIEKGENSRLLLEDVFQLDEALDTRGKLVALAWDALELVFHIGLLFNINHGVYKSPEIYYANRLVNLSRWYQTCGLSMADYRDWVDSLRDMVKKS